jgi:hypothetical protein
MQILFIYLFMIYLTTLSVAQTIIASNDTMINESWIEKDTEGMRKATQILSQYSRPRSRDLKP